MDTVYLNQAIGPGQKDWVHCKVQRVTPEGVAVDIPSGYSNTRVFYPMHVVQRIEYGDSFR